MFPVNISPKRYSIVVKKTKAKKKTNKGLCVLCGKRPATTRDHVPPKGAFARPLPSDLITIPACSKCNREASKNDEKFRVYLSLHVGVDTPRTKALWENHAFRSIQHNRRLRDIILRSMRPIEIRSKGGVIIGKQTGVLWDSEAHDEIIKRTIRGLHYHHFGDVLPADKEIKVNWHRELSDEMVEMSSEWSQHKISHGELIYRFGRAVDDPSQSIWLFQFYGKHWASGYTKE